MVVVPVRMLITVHGTFSCGFNFACVKFIQVNTRWGGHVLPPAFFVSKTAKRVCITFDIGRRSGSATEVD